MWRHRRWFLVGVGTLLLVGTWLTFRLGAAPLAHPRVITVQAGQWRYSPGIITVNEGDLVTIVLKTDDVAHGFYLDGYGIQRQVLPDQSTEIHFVANRAGRWMFRCSVTCGPFHPYMIGWLRVQPNLALRLGWIAVGTIGATALFAAWEEARGR